MKLEQILEDNARTRNHYKVRLGEIPPTYSVGQTISRMKEYITNYLYRTHDWLRKFY